MVARGPERPARSSGAASGPSRHHGPVLCQMTISLREPTTADAGAIVAAAQDPEIPRWTTIPSPYTLDHALAWIGAEDDEERFLVVDGEDRLLGAIGLMHPDEPEAEIGYWLAREARGRGVATRAVMLLRDWAVRAHGVRTVVLLIHRDNAPSQRVATRAGFADSGELRPCPRQGCGTGAADHRVYRWTAA